MRSFGQLLAFLLWWAIVFGVSCGYRVNGRTYGVSACGEPINVHVGEP